MSMFPTISLASKRLAELGYIIEERGIEVAIVKSGKAVFSTLYEYEILEAAEQLVKAGRITPHKIGTH